MTTAIADTPSLIREIDILLDDYRQQREFHKGGGNRERFKEIIAKMDTLLDRRLDLMRVRDKVKTTTPSLSA